MKKEDLEKTVTPEVASAEVEGAVTKKEKTAKKIKKMAARSAQLITYIQANQEGRNAAEVIVEGVFKVFGGYEDIPNFPKVVEMVGKYQESPDKAAKILSPLAEEKRAERKAKRAKRKQDEIAALVAAAKK